MCSRKMYRRKFLPSLVAEDCRCYGERDMMKYFIVGTL